MTLGIGHYCISVVREARGRIKRLIKKGMDMSLITTQYINEPCIFKILFGFNYP